MPYTSSYPKPHTGTYTEQDLRRAFQSGWTESLEIILKEAPHLFENYDLLREEIELARKKFLAANMHPLFEGIVFFLRRNNINPYPGLHQVDKKTVETEVTHDARILIDSEPYDDEYEAVGQEERKSSAAEEKFDRPRTHVYKIFLGNNPRYLRYIEELVETKKYVDDQNPGSTLSIVVDDDFLLMLKENSLEDGTPYLEFLRRNNIILLHSDELVESHLESDKDILNAYELLDSDMATASRADILKFICLRGKKEYGPQDAILIMDPDIKQEYRPGAPNLPEEILKGQEMKYLPEFFIPAKALTQTLRENQEDPLHQELLKKLSSLADNEAVSFIISEELYLFLEITRVQAARNLGPALGPQYDRSYYLSEREVIASRHNLVTVSSALENIVKLVREKTFDPKSERFVNECEKFLIAGNKPRHQSARSKTKLTPDQFCIIGKERSVNQHWSRDKAEVLIGEDETIFIPTLSYLNLKNIIANLALAQGKSYPSHPYLPYDEEHEETPLSKAVLSGNISETIAQVNKPELTQQEYNKALHYSLISRGGEKTALPLVKFGFKKDKLDINHLVVVSTLGAANGKSDVVRYVVRKILKSDSLNKETKIKYLQDILDNATVSGHLDTITQIFDQILDLKPDYLNQVVNDIKPVNHPLERALQAKNLKVIELYINHGFDYNTKIKGTLNLVETAKEIKEKYDLDDGIEDIIEDKFDNYERRFSRSNDHLSQGVPLSALSTTFAATAALTHNSATTTKLAIATLSATIAATGFIEFAYQRIKRAITSPEVTTTNPQQETVEEKILSDQAKDDFRHTTTIAENSLLFAALIPSAFNKLRQNRLLRKEAEYFFDELFPVIIYEFFANSIFDDKGLLAQALEQKEEAVKLGNETDIKIAEEKLAKAYEKLKNKVVTDFEDILYVLPDSSDKKDKITALLAPIRGEETNLINEINETKKIIFAYGFKINKGKVVIDSGLEVEMTNFTKKCEIYLTYHEIMTNEDHKELKEEIIKIAEDSKKPPIKVIKDLVKIYGANFKVEETPELVPILLEIIKKRASSSKTSHTPKTTTKNPYVDRSATPAPEIASLVY